MKNVLTAILVMATTATAPSNRLLHVVKEKEIITINVTLPTVTVTPPQELKSFFPEKGWFTSDEWKGKHIKDKQQRKKFSLWKKRYIAKTIEFTKHTVDSLLALEKYQHIDRGVFIAQAILESGYGTSRLANLADNWFGHKCYSCKKYVDANNDHPGDKFSIRKNVTASFVEHAELLMRKFYIRIPNSRKANPSRRDWLHALCGCGWKLETQKSREFVDDDNYVYATSCFSNKHKGYARKLYDLTKRLKI